MKRKSYLRRNNVQSKTPAPRTRHYAAVRGQVCRLQDVQAPGKNEKKQGRTGLDKEEPDGGGAETWHNDSEDTTPYNTAPTCCMWKPWKSAQQSDEIVSKEASKLASTLAPSTPSSGERKGTAARREAWKWGI